MDDGWRQKPGPAVAVLVVVPPEEVLPEGSAVLQDPNRSGKSGLYLIVLNWASENGLSLETCGRLCILVTAKSASSSATGLLRIDEPRSACSVSWPG